MMSTFYGCTNLSGTILIKSPEVGSAYLGGGKHETPFRDCFDNIEQQITVKVLADSRTHDWLLDEQNRFTHDAIVIETYSLEQE